MSSPLNQIKEIWNRLPNSGRIATVGAGVATLALILAMVYYGSQSEYGVLFSDLKPADAQSIVDKLKAENVPYSLTNGGTAIQVPADRISDLRLQMAGTGVLSGGHVGFDLFDKANFGATDFTQQVNYRRAIEGELSRTLEGMDEVESVRVHITPKKESVYTEKADGAKASVMLRVKQGKELSNERTEAIVSLISSSVEGLDPASVSVMDTRGRLLTSGRGKSTGPGDVGAFNAQIEAKQKFQAENAARVISLLEPVVGDGKVRADVAADIDFSQIEQTEEKYNPQSQVVRSQQNSQENRTSAIGNTPQQTGVVGPRAADPAAVQTAPIQQNNNDQRNATVTSYEIDKTVRKTIGGGGRVNRITVSVVLDYKNVDGVEVARTPEEVQKLQELVQAAVGTDTNRGDSVVVQTMAFNKPAEEAAAAASFLDKNKSLISNSIKYAALIVVALLIFFFIIRPAKRHLKAASISSGEPPLLPPAEIGRRSGDAEALRENSLAQGQPMMTVGEMQAQMQNEPDNVSFNNQSHRGEKIKKLLAEQTLSNPETVAGTLRGWLKEA